MFGAIIGDIVGSRFEHNNHKSKDFELWHEKCKFTDDSVCTAAVADILRRDKPPATTLQRWCRDYPARGYGGHFSNWILRDPPRAYGSYGNGAAMRVSPAALIHRADLAAALDAADRVTAVTHDHAEGIKGARATTHAIWLALDGDGASADDIRDTIAREYDYDLSPSVDDIRPQYSFDVTCQGTVPQAIICALESTDFEDAIRNAISIGGDSDTIAAIAGALGEALHRLPRDFVTVAGERYLDARIAETIGALYD
ncbi:MAG: ADP-ribosylglycohydrolase family protein [bacterium]